jgi:GNAT superfamily N-acetyltransferase
MRLIFAREKRPVFNVAKGGQRRAIGNPRHGSTNRYHQLRLNRTCAQPHRADLPRIHQIRHGTAENRLTNSSLVTDAEVAWYMDEAIFLVSEDGTNVQGFTCANHQTAYVWTLFVIDEAQGRGHGTALLNAGTARLK